MTQPFATPDGEPQKSSGRSFFFRSDISRRRWQAFRSNRRGYISLWLFIFLFSLSLCADIVANDRPLLLMYKGQLYVPALADYPETTFGGQFETAADFRDPAVQELVSGDGWMLWPPVRFSYDTINYNVAGTFPSPPTLENPLGTDNSGRDILARILYGFRLSVSFGLCLAAFSTITGVLVGAFLGYRGGWTDILGQRFIEIWSGMPVTYLLIILSSLMEPGFFILLGIILLFSWMGLVDVVRAEFLRCRNLDYVLAARVMGVGDRAIILRHMLPNALIATTTYLPFIINGAIISLTSLDFLGLGLPAGTPSLGDLLAQGKAHLESPWIGISAFVVLALQLTLLVFIGEGVRDAIDPYNEELP